MVNKNGHKDLRKKLQDLKSENPIILKDVEINLYKKGESPVGVSVAEHDRSIA